MGTFGKFTQKQRRVFYVMSAKTEICYLCGKPITAEVSRDHVPPLQFFPSDIRKKISFNLLTLATHFKCNQSYQKDEDYFVSSFVPITEASAVHKYLLNDIRRKLARAEATNLYQLIINEFDDRPSGLHLLNDAVVKRVKFARVKRIIEKIVKGLHFFHFRDLEIGLGMKIKFYTAGDALPESYYKVMNSTAFIGNYPEIFCYQVKGISFLPRKTTFYVYFLVFWNSVGALITVRK